MEQDDDIFIQASDAAAFYSAPTPVMGELVRVTMYAGEEAGASLPGVSTTGRQLRQVKHYIAATSTDLFAACKVVFAV